MKLLALYWSFLIIGYIIAWRSAKREKTFDGLAKAMMMTVYGLCLIMGLRMGANEQVIENLGTMLIEAQKMGKRKNAKGSTTTPT